MAARTVTLALLVALAPAAALAQPEEPSGKDESRWYGHEILIIDALGLGVLTYAVLQEDAIAYGLGAGTLVLGSPIVHGSHHQVGNAFLSLPLRIVLPLAGAGVGVYINDGCDFECHNFPIKGVLIGTTLGYAAAVLIDARWLAHTRPRRDRSSSLSWAPLLGVSGNGVSTGIRGTF